MSYQPIARKYRPQTFADLIGQSHVTTTLTRAIESKRIGQAYLFAGQRGVGKTSAARILAKSLNCAKGPTATPCQQCPSCVAITSGTSLDVIEIDGASNRGIDDIRQLREHVKFSPVHGQFRVYIIDEVHQITTDGFNALLKTLEEPPAHARFIFATTSPQKVPATILSRCQRFDFRRVPSATIVDVLRRIAAAEGITADDAALYAIAHASEGSLRDAEVVFEQLISFCERGITEEDVTQLLGSVEHDALLVWAQALLDRDARAALGLLHEQLERGKDVAQLLTALMTHIRNLLVVRTAESGPSRAETLARLVDLPVERLDALERQAARPTVEELLFIGQILAGAHEWIRRSPFAQAILEFALIRVATRESWTSLDDVMQRLERASTRQSGGEPPKPSASSAARPTVVAPTPASKSSAPAPKPANVSKAEAVEPMTTEATGSLSLQEVIDRWPKILEHIAGQKMSLASYLIEAQPLELGGTRLRVGLPGFSLHQEVLNATEHVRMIERALREVVGPLKIDYTTMPDDPGAASVRRVALQDPRDPVPPVVQDIVAMFDASIVRQSKPPLAPA